MGILGKRKKGGRSTAGQGSRRRTRRSMNISGKRRTRGPGGTSGAYHFKRYFTSGSIAGPIVGNAAYNPYISNVSEFTFGNISGVGDFTGLFDQYRFNYIVAKFWLRIDPSAQTAASASYPKLWYYRDYDDATPIASLAEMRERSNTVVKVLHPNRPVVVRFKPNALNLMYSTPVASNYEPVWNKWFDMSTTSSRHYGFKYAIDDLTNTNYRVDVEVIAYFSCRGVR